jgi:small-conductance mechanosensitive channel
MVGCDAAWRRSNHSFPRTVLPLARALRLVILVLMFAFPPLVAIGAAETPRQVLDTTRAALNDIDSAMKSSDLTDSDLARLRAENDPLAALLQAVIAELTPRLEASRKRLIELTPKAKETTATSDSATDELKAEQARHDSLDADLRSARAMLLQADDSAGRIGAARRDLFARRTFARSASVVSPLLWSSVAREAPADLATIGRVFADWARGLAQRISRTEALNFVLVMLALIVTAAPLRWIAHRVIQRDPSIAAPTRLRRALAAAWTIAVLAALPLTGLGVLAYALDYFDISDPRIQGVVDGLLDGLRLMALAHAFARGLLAPGQPNWRMMGLTDRQARRLFRFALLATAIWSIEKFMEPIADAAGSYNLAVAARAVCATLIPMVAARTLRLIADPASAVPGARDSGAPARTLAWALTVSILAAALTGYIAFAAFLITQSMFMVALGTALFLMDAAVQEGAEVLFRYDATIGQVLMTIVGLRRETLEQIVVLVQGFARLAGLVAAVALALGPLGLPSQDFAATLRAAYFGFTIGGVTISLSSLFAAAAVFVLGVAATRGAQNWLGERYLPRTRLDAGVSNSIRTIVGYLGVVLALLASGSRLGLDLQQFAIIAGALSVGIGFGLQGIVNNFVSGLILLWERGIRVGDWVVVGAEQGFVRRINARATEIETFDRATLLVPNLTLVTGAVKNWMHNDRIARIIVAVNVDFEADAEVVRELLIGAAKAQEAVLSIPAPLVLFSEFGDWALKFQLICFIDDALMAERVRSEMNFDVLRRMREAGLRTPYPFPVAR